MYFFVKLKSEHLSQTVQMFWFSFSFFSWENNKVLFIDLDMLWNAGFRFFCSSDYQAKFLWPVTITFIDIRFIFLFIFLFHFSLYFLFRLFLPFLDSKIWKKYRVTNIFFSLCKSESRSRNKLFQGSFRSLFMKDLTYLLTRINAQLSLLNSYEILKLNFHKVCI
jgi:hypothetical protein